MTLSLDTAYRSFGGEVEASSTPTICRLSDSRRHQLSAIALAISRVIARAKVPSTGRSIEESKLHALAATMTAVAPDGHAVTIQNTDIIATASAERTPVSAATTGSDQSRRAAPGAASAGVE